MRAVLCAAILLLTAGVPPTDPFDRAVAALSAGSAAARDNDTKRLALAVADLRASGATPVDADDVTRRWLPNARARPSPPYRDRALGPGYRTISLKGDGVWHLEQIFLAGQHARIAVVAARPGSFAMQVKGDEGETVCRAATPQRQCDWVPAYTARFSIDVRNSSRLAGQYFVVLQ